MSTADAAVLQQLAPTGRLRVAIAVAPRPWAQFAIQDGDQYRGVAVTFGTALAKKLGVPVGIMQHKASGRNAELGRRQRWDVAPSCRSTPSARNSSRLGNAYHLLQSTFLVAPGSKIASVKDANAKGVGIRHRQHRHLPSRRQGDVRGHPYRICRCRRRGRRHEQEEDRGNRAVGAKSLSGLVSKIAAHASSTTLSSIPPPRSACPRASRPRSGVRQRVHRGSESLRPRAPGARRDGLEVVDCGSGGDEALESVRRLQG